MFFSVLIPVYNAEKYIGNCIKSVLNQEEQDFELIVVNDGSIDNSKNIINSYAKNDKRIKIINQPNMGLFHTRCIGIEHSKGEYIIFLDADDTLKSSALKKLKNTLLDGDIDMVIYRAEIIHQSGKSHIEKKQFENNVIFTGKSKFKLYNRILEGSSLNNIWTKAIKKTCFELDKIKKYPRITMEEDLLHTLRPITNAKKIKYIDEVLYNYQINNLSMTRKFDSNTYTSYKFVHEKLFDYLKEWNIDTDDRINMIYVRYLKSIGSTIMYSPSNIKSKEVEYTRVLRIIKQDELFTRAYYNAYNILPLIHKIPIWLLTKEKSKILLNIKPIITKMRQNA